MSIERREYLACSNPKRHRAFITADEGFLDTIKQDARVLPLYEERINKFKYTRGYSLNNNEMLKCRWSEFSTTRKPKIPFKFPSIKNMHFVKGTVMHEPKETVRQRTNHRLHLRSGPGIDRYGQLPIPNDMMHLRKTAYIEPRDNNSNKNGKVIKLI